MWYNFLCRLLYESKFLLLCPFFVKKTVFRSWNRVDFLFGASHPPTPLPLSSFFLFWNYLFLAPTEGFNPAGLFPNEVSLRSSYSLKFTYLNLKLASQIWFFSKKFVSGQIQYEDTVFNSKILNIYMRRY